jgi:hypothetical protein
MRSNIILILKSSKYSDVAYSCQTCVKLVSSFRHVLANLAPYNFLETHSKISRSSKVQNINTAT